MNNDNNQTIKRALGTFETRTQAESALRELKDAGFNMDKVSIITRHNGSDTNLSGTQINTSNSQQAKEGAKAGATGGTVTGGILGLIGGLGVLALPGVGPVAELGVVLANTLLGSGIGAAGGSLIGALIGWGIPEEKAKYYDERLSEGDYLVLIEGTIAELNAAESILERQHIRNWGVYDAPSNHPVSGMGVV